MDLLLSGAYYQTVGSSKRVQFLQWRAYVTSSLYIKICWISTFSSQIFFLLIGHLLGTEDCLQMSVIRAWGVAQVQNILKRWGIVTFIGALGIFGTH